MFDTIYWTMVLLMTMRVYSSLAAIIYKKSLKLSDCQGLEACHSGLRKSDRRHNCDIKHAQVST